MVEIVVDRLGMDPSMKMCVVILREKAGTRLLPIWIGLAEADAIANHAAPRARPMTHDLCRSLIVGLSAVVRRVDITHVEKNTYFGELHLERNGAFMRIDSRPSDAIAIALRFGAPIFADESLLMLPDQDEDDEQKMPFETPPVSEGSELSPEQLKEHLEHLRPEDFGKFNL
jgi:bifunctional DNase/RNase